MLSDSNAFEWLSELKKQILLWDHIIVVKCHNQILLAANKIWLINSSFWILIGCYWSHIKTNIKTRPKIPIRASKLGNQGTGALRDGHVEMHHVIEWDTSCKRWDTTGGWAPRPYAKPQVVSHSLRCVTVNTALTAPSRPCFPRNGAVIGILGLILSEIWLRF